MGKGGKVNRSELANTKFVDAQAKSHFKSAGWYKFLQKFPQENVALLLVVIAGTKLEKRAQ